MAEELLSLTIKEHMKDMTDEERIHFLESVVINQKMRIDGLYTTLRKLYSVMREAILDYNLDYDFDCLVSKTKKEK